MSAEAAGWDWLQIIVTAAGSGVTALTVTIFLHYADKPDQVEQWVEKDPDYREELAGKLRGARIGATYRDLLTRGLDWLDRNWGEARSARALGICIIIGLCGPRSSSPGESAVRDTSAAPAWRGARSRVGSS